MPEYEFLDHTADLAVKVKGKDLPSLFINATRAMTEYLGMDLPSPGAGEGEERGQEIITLSAPDQNSLLVSWLSEILYHTLTKRKIYTDYKINELTAQSLKAEIIGEPQKKFAHDIKAVTYHSLDIKKVAAGYEVVITFDI